MASPSFWSWTIVLEKMKLLLDTGASPEVMLHNADALHLDLSQLDLNLPQPRPLK